jgi:phosphoglycerol transferase MdoB-like AlkP superfamily enzyme
MENMTNEQRGFFKKRADALWVFLCKQKNLFKTRYGILGFIAILLVMGKLLLFYQLMSITTNLFFIWMTTCLILGILFSFFRNKWIPLILFTFISILMFSDVTYSTFFNRYLSVGMLGAAEVLGDIGESIKAVIRPHFFFLFLDVVVLYVTFFVHKIPWRKPVIRNE